MISSNIMRPVGLVALSGLLASVNANALVERQVTTCSTLHVMIAGGCAMPCTADYEGLLESLVAKVTGAFPGSDKYLVPYSGSMVQGAVSSAIMKQAANEYAAACPNTPIVFLGYSLGGIIVMNTLCGGLTAQASANVLAAVSYGEETFTFPQSYAAGTCTTSAPLYPRGDTAACAPLAPALKSYCDANDPKCCATGTVDSAHFVYPSSYDQLALEFIQGRAADFSVGGNITTPTISPVGPIVSSTMSIPYPANSTMPGLPGTGIPTGPAPTGPAPTGPAPTGPAPTGPAPPVTTITTTIGGSVTITIVSTLTRVIDTTRTVTIPTVFSTPVFPTTGPVPSTLIPISDILEPSGAPMTGTTTNSLSTVVQTLTRTNSAGNTVTLTLTTSPGSVGTGSPAPFNPSSTIAPFNNAGISSSSVPIFFKWAAALAGFLALI